MESAKKAGSIRQPERPSAMPVVQIMRAGRTDFELNVLVPRLRLVCFVIASTLLVMYLAMVIDTTIGAVHSEFPLLQYVPNFNYRHNVISCIMSYISIMTCILYMVGLIKKITNFMWAYILVHIVLLFDLVVQMLESIIETINGKYSISASICSSIMVVLGSIILYYMIIYYQFLRYPDYSHLYIAS